MILSILQARMSSNRLPGKVLKPILGKPMLSLQIERIKRSRKIDQLIVATSKEISDDEIEDLCNKMQIQCYRGDLNNVLDRFYQAALLYKPEHIVRLTGDCPLIDPEIIDKVIEFYIRGKFDYATNSIKPYTFPDGLDVEVFTFSVLETARKEASLSAELEHVTPYIRSNPARFRIGRYDNDTDLSKLRWTVDREEDFKFVKRIYEILYPQNKTFVTKDILHLLKEDPSLLSINSNIHLNQ